MVTQMSILLMIVRKHVNVEMSRIIESKMRRLINTITLQADPVEKSRLTESQMRRLVHTIALFTRVLPFPRRTSSLPPSPKTMPNLLTSTIGYGTMVPDSTEDQLWRNSTPPKTSQSVSQSPTSLIATTTQIVREMGLLNYAVNCTQMVYLRQMMSTRGSGIRGSWIMALLSPRSNG